MDLEARSSGPMVLLHRLVSPAAVITQSGRTPDGGQPSGCKRTDITVEGQRERRTEWWTGQDRPRR